MKFHNEGEHSPFTTGPEVGVKEVRGVALAFIKTLTLTGTNVPTGLQRTFGAPPEHPLAPQIQAPRFGVHFASRLTTSWRDRAEEAFGVAGVSPIEVLRGVGQG